MTILTASMGTSVEQSAGRGSEGCLITCSTARWILRYHVLLNVFYLTTLKKNSGHVKKWWSTIRLHPVACKGKWMMCRTIQALAAVFNNTNPVATVSPGP